MNLIPTVSERHPLAALRDVALGYHGRPILRHVSLTVAAGECWALVGPNGRGKTTLVNALLGVVQPLAGELVLAAPDGRRPAIGHVPQHPPHHGYLPTTVREFVDLGMVGLKLSRAERAERLAAALAEVGLADRARSSLWALSGGQRQRALIARALVRHPALLVLDEPTAGLDVNAEQALLALLARLRHQQGLTVLLVTHDLALARAFASHAALFLEGTVRAGPVAEVLTPALVAAAFGPLPAEEPAP
jgi:ABC-type Mn2+/Zn2+ transport system ATPase subunit